MQAIAYINNSKTETERACSLAKSKLLKEGRISWLMDFASEKFDLMGQTVACNACGCELDSASASRHGPRFFCPECAQLILGSEDAASVAAPQPVASVSRVVPVPKAQSSVSKASKPIARTTPPIIEDDPCLLYTSDAADE